VPGRKIPFDPGRNFRIGGRFAAFSIVFCRRQIRPRKFFYMSDKCLEPFIAASFPAKKRIEMSSFQGYTGIDGPKCPISIFHRKRWTEMSNIHFGITTDGLKCLTSNFASEPDCPTSKERSSTFFKNAQNGNSFVQNNGKIVQHSFEDFRRNVQNGD